MLGKVEGPSWEGEPLGMIRALLATNCVATSSLISSDASLTNCVCVGGGGTGPPFLSQMWEVTLCVVDTRWRVLSNLPAFDGRCE
jgi:hypothetical protein